MNASRQQVVDYLCGDLRSENEQLRDDCDLYLELLKDLLQLQHEREVMGEWPGPHGRKEGSWRWRWDKALKRANDAMDWDGGEP